METTEFTPLAGLLGGFLIGVAATGLLWLLGRVAGASGILYGALFGKGEERRWRFAFALGLPTGALLYKSLIGVIPTTIEAGPLTVAIAGLLVGFGTRLGHGCTSGHGVVGLASFSKRSALAVLVFMTTAAVTAYIKRHLL